MESHYLLSSEHIKFAESLFRLAGNLCKNYICCSHAYQGRKSCALSASCGAQRRWRYPPAWQWLGINHPVLALLLRLTPAWPLPVLTQVSCKSQDEGARLGPFQASWCSPCSVGKKGGLDLLFSYKCPVLGSLSRLQLKYTCRKNSVWIQLGFRLDPAAGGWEMVGTRCHCPFVPSTPSTCQVPREAAHGAAPRDTNPRKQLTPWQALPPKTSNSLRSSVGCMKPHGSKPRSALLLLQRGFATTQRA